MTGQVEHAVADGYDVRGLMYWTLVDNFEVGLPLPTGLKLSTLAPHEMRNHQGNCNDCFRAHLALIFLSCAQWAFGWAPRFGLWEWEVTEPSQVCHLSKRPDLQGIGCYSDLSAHQSLTECSLKQPLSDCRGARRERAPRQ